MPREADFDITEQRGHEDDSWFDDSGSHASMARRDKRARVVIGIAMAVVLLLGIALGAFSSGTAKAGPDVERLRARAKAAGTPSPLTSDGNEVLLTALDRLVSAMPPPVPVPVPVADVVSADAATDAVAADAVDAEVAAVEVDAGPVAKVETKVEAKVEPPKPKEPKEPKASGDPFGIPRLEPKDAKVEPPKDAKVEPPKDAKIEDPKLKGPVDQALADAKAALDAGRWADAKAGYEKVLQLSPGNTRGLLGRGRSLLELRQVQPALKDIKAVLDAEPRNPTALLLAGSISQELGQKDQARGFYQRYLDAWPSGRKAAEVKALLERL